MEENHYNSTAAFALPIPVYPPRSRLMWHAHTNDRDKQSQLNCSKFTDDIIYNGIQRLGGHSQIMYS